MSHVPGVSAALNSTRANSAALRQSTNEVLMVAPTAFGFNDQVGCGMPCPLNCVHANYLGTTWKVHPCQLNASEASSCSISLCAGTMVGTQGWGQASSFADRLVMDRNVGLRRACR